MKNLSLTTLVMILSVWLVAQSDSEIRERPAAQAHVISEAPIIDGNVLQDPVWTAIKTIGQLVQSQPNYGESA